MFGKTKNELLPKLKAGTESENLARKALSVNLRFPKPKILLIDMNDDSSSVLNEAGYNVASGTFGAPYEVEKSDTYQVVARDYSIPNYSEQEIVIVDLLPPETISEPQNPHQSVLGDYDYWCKCNYGLIDPRPAAINIFRQDFDRIVKHGGIFIIFADRRTSYEVVLARNNKRGLALTGDTYDNWDLLTGLERDSFVVNYVQGSEISVVSLNGILSRIVARHFTWSEVFLHVWAHAAHSNSTHDDTHQRTLPIVDDNSGQ